jgi:carbon monoxide dehydrogenase subunit G
MALGKWTPDLIIALDSDTGDPIDVAPDRVFAFLLDINRVVACMPGVELSEVVDPDTFKGKVRIKVGPIAVAYSGTARISERNHQTRTARLEALGRETTGSGSANATATMSVVQARNGSEVRLVTELAIAGRIANFGRGMMEDVSRTLIGQMANCIKSSLEEVPAESDSQAASTPSGSVPAPLPARPVNALTLLFTVLMNRLRRLFARHQ